MGILVSVPGYRQHSVTPAIYYLSRPFGQLTDIGGVAPGQADNAVRSNTFSNFGGLIKTPSSSDHIKLDPSSEGSSFSCKLPFCSCKMGVFY